MIQATQQDGALLHDIRAHLVQKLDRMCKDLPALKAQAIADIVSGQTPDIETADLGIARYGR